MAQITTGRTDFATLISNGDLPPSGYFTVGFDLADGLLKKLNSAGVLTIIEVSSGAFLPLAGGVMDSGSLVKTVLDSNSTQGYIAFKEVADSEVGLSGGEITIGGTYSGLSIRNRSDLNTYGFYYFDSKGSVRFSLTNSVSSSFFVETGNFDLRANIGSGQRTFSISVANISSSQTIYLGTLYRDWETK